MTLAVLAQPRTFSTVLMPALAACLRLRYEYGRLGPSVYIYILYTSTRDQCRPPRTSGGGEGVIPVEVINRRVVV